jgi:predicted dithiol-disulfide oxidoreductase (DUF899 family)
MSIAEIEELERELLGLKERIVKAKRSLPRQRVEDYTFSAPGGTEVRLSELFGGKDDLILVHNMGTGCPYCTMWADGFTGVLAHLMDRAAFVVVSPDPPEVQKRFAAGRHWNFRMVSAKGTTFNKDMGFEEPDGSPDPGVTTFHREPDGGIVRVASAPFGPGDDFCVVWPFLDLLADGAAGWEPQYKYEG